MITIDVDALSGHESTTTGSRETRVGESSRSGDVPAVDAIDPKKDTAVIEKFYQYLANDEIEQMNTLVARPLKNTKTWQDHRNAKNIGIFTRNLEGELKLENIFLIPGSYNDKTAKRQYSYTLKYTIAPDHSFQEDWKITLQTQASGETLIAEIMCTTTKCSTSPFFWPQNLNLK